VKRSKYGNIKTHGFDSKAEYSRWLELKLLEKAGKIKDLRKQVPYWIIINRIPVCSYIADTVYEENGKTVVEDVKGVRTAVYRLKKKLMLAHLGIKIKEVSAKDLGIRRKR